MLLNNGGPMLVKTDIGSRYGSRLGADSQTGARKPEKAARVHSVPAPHECPVMPEGEVRDGRYDDENIQDADGPPHAIRRAQPRLAPTTQDGGYETCHEKRVDHGYDLVASG